MELTRLPKWITQPDLIHLHIFVRTPGTYTLLLAPGKCNNESNWPANSFACLKTELSPALGMKIAKHAVAKSPCLW